MRTDTNDYVLTDVYRYINPSKNPPHFYELLRKNHSHLYFLLFRVVKIKTAENTYEYLITNLPFSFTLDDIRECYLKHAAGLLYFHSKQPEFLKQEIYSRLILYNFGIFIANEAAEENRKKKRDGTGFWISVSSATEYPSFWQMDSICLFGIPVFGFLSSKYRIFDNN